MLLGFIFTNNSFILLTLKTFFCYEIGLVGWVLRHANPSCYFMPKTFLFIIFIWYNFYASSYLNAINKYQ